MKYIYLLIFFLSAFSSNNALAFWNKVSDAQKEDCLNKAETFGSTTFTSKKRYQQCIKAIKEENKQNKNTERLVEKYYDDCFPDLFEDFKLQAHKIINRYRKRGPEESFLRKVDLNPEDNRYFRFTEYQSYLLFGDDYGGSSSNMEPINNPFGASYEKPATMRQKITRTNLNALRNNFWSKLESCAENKSKPFF